MQRDVQIEPLRLIVGDDYVLELQHELEPSQPENSMSPISAQEIAVPYVPLGVPEGTLVALENGALVVLVSLIHPAEEHARRPERIRP